MTPGRADSAWLWVLGTLLFAALALRISVTPTRFLDVDELEHLNAAYAIAHGESLYGSLFENHPPLLYWSLQPLVRSAMGAEQLIRAARWGVLAPCLGMVLFAGLAARRIAGVNAALLAPLLLLTSLYFFQKGVEVRPDVPGAFFLLLGSWLLARQRRGEWIAAGVSFGLALFFTPKAIFGAFGVVLGRVLFDLAQSPRSGSRVLPTGCVLLGGFLASASVLAMLASSGALSGFLNDCVGTSAHMTIDHPWATRRELLSTAVLKANPVTWILGTIGTASLIRRRGALENDDSPLRMILACGLIAAFAGFFLMNAPLRQYFLFVLPLLSIVAASTSVQLASLAPVGAKGATLKAMLLLGLIAPPALSLLPVQKQGLELEVLRTVLQTTSPQDRVLDFWSGLYVTRLPAYRYFFLNRDVIRLLPAAKLEEELNRVLDDRRVRAVIVDDHFRLLPKSVQKRIRDEFGVVQDFGILVVMARRE